MTSVVLPHALLAAAFILWCMLHSLLTAPGWMRCMHSMFGPRTAYYRLAYVIVSIITLVPILLLWRRTDSPELWEWPAFVALLRWIGVAASLVVLAVAARSYDQVFFFGFRQIREHRAGARAEFSGFVTAGILRRIRHPYYSAGILLLLCWGDATAANLIVAAIGVGYLVIGAFLEERKLVTEFGEEYRRYQREVPMFIPCPREKRNA